MNENTDLLLGLLKLTFRASVGQTKVSHTENGSSAFKSRTIPKESENMKMIMAL